MTAQIMAAANTWGQSSRGVSIVGFLLLLAVLFWMRYKMRRERARFEETHGDRVAEVCGEGNASRNVSARGDASVRDRIDPDASER